MNVNIYIYHFERLSHFSQCLPAIAVAIGTATTIVAPLVRMHLTGLERCAVQEVTQIVSWERLY